MKKPNGYDEAKASGEFTPIELGGHYCVIKQVTEKESSTGKDMIVVLFDFCKPDNQEGMFTETFKSDDRADKKWPFAGTKYILTQDFKDASKTNRDFKAFCTQVEESNNFEIKWFVGSDWGRQFVGKKIGVVFGEEENEYDGKTFMRRIPKYFCKFDKAKDAKIPMTKYLKNKETIPAPAAPELDGFLSIPDGTEEEIPF